MLYNGIWRGIVVDNDDTDLKYKHLGRVKIRVDQVYGKNTKDDDLPWAWPCASAGGGRSENDKLHGSLMLPPVDSSVWVMFEQGVPDRPVWMGTWWGTEPVGRSAERTPELPAEAIEDEDAGVEYPDIYLFKFPFGDQDTDIFVRCSSDQKLEVVFGENSVSFVKNFDSDNEVLVHTKDWKIRLETDEGDIEINAPEGNILLNAGKDIIIEADENASVLAGINAKIDGTEESRVSSGKKIVGAAPRASGFTTR